MEKYPESNKVKFTISGIQSKLTGHAKKQENTTHNEKNNQSVASNSELTQMLRLAEDI